MLLNNNLVQLAEVSLLVESLVALAFAVLAESKLHTSDLAEIRLGNTEDLSVLLVGGEVDVVGGWLTNPDAVQVVGQHLVSSDGVSSVSVGKVDSQDSGTTVHSDVEGGESAVPLRESINDEGLRVAVVSREDDGCVQAEGRSVQDIDPTSALTIDSNTNKQEVAIGRSADNVSST